MRYARVTKSVEFDAGHRVPEHTSKCRNPHGHRYKVEVTCVGDIPEDGMVVDFGVLKALLVEHVHDVFDHAMIVWADDDDLLAAMQTDLSWKTVVMARVPTAENIAWWVHDRVGTRLAEVPGLTLCTVRVYETPTSVAEVPG